MVARDRLERAMEEKIDRRDITDADVFVMGKGEWYRSFEKMGAHPATRDGREGFRFSVWVPDVRSVHVGHCRRSSGGASHRRDLVRICRGRKGRRPL